MLIGTTFSITYFNTIQMIIVRLFPKFSWSKGFINAFVYLTISCVCGYIYYLIFEVQY
jgi:hypothetical protein